MIIAEMMFIIVSQLHWNNILLLNANDEGRYHELTQWKTDPRFCMHDWWYSNHIWKLLDGKIGYGKTGSINLIQSLNSDGRLVTTVDYENIKNYPWPERMDMKPPLDGFLMIAEAELNLTEILRFLREKHLLSPTHQWIIGIEGYVSLSDILPLFDEGERVVVIGNISVSDDIRNEEKQETFDHYTDDINEDISIWTLRSLGNGSIRLEKTNFQNLSSVDKIFDSPFRNFWGRTLRISSLGSPPISIKPGKGETRWHGYIFRIINTFADFFNFTYTVKEADNRLYGLAQEDGSWTGMIGELITKVCMRGKWILDLVTCPGHLKRSLVVDLTQPVFPETVTFIYRAPEFYSRTWILFQGIQSKVWIGMISASVAAFTAYFLALSLHQLWQHKKKDPSTVCIESADESISSLYRALLGKGVVNVPFPVSCRTVLGAWFVASLILSALYGGGLTSKLSLHKSPKPADSLKELLRRHPDAMIAVRNDSQIHGFFKKSPSWNKVWQKNMEKYVIPGHYKINDTMIRVHNSSNPNAPYVWVAERSMLVKLMREYSEDPVICDLYVGSEDLIRSDWSIALQRDSPFYMQFDELITRMERFGLLEKWRRKYWNPSTGYCHPNDGLNPTGETPITLDDTRAIFLILAIGWIVGFVVLIVERRCYKSI